MISLSRRISFGRKGSAVAVRGAVSLIALVIAAPASAQDLRTVRHFDIAAQPLGQALVTFSAQSDAPVMVSDDLVAGKRARAVRGDMSPAQALDRLLAGSALKMTRSVSGAITIRPMGAPGESQGGGDDVSLLEEQDGSMGEEIVVTGTNIRGIAPIGAKVTIIDRRQIEESGYGRIEDILQTLPQNFSGVSEDFNQSLVANQNQGAEIQLRGLGPGTTLTLINGRRIAGAGSLGAFVDVSAIPLAAIARVEILPDGASALYGTDAIGGVANIHLRRNFDGVEARARFATADGAANAIEASLTGGKTWNSGHIVAGYQYSRRNAFLYSDSPYGASGDLSPFGGTDHRRDTPVRRGGAPGNILNAAGNVAYAIPDQDGRNLTVGQLLPGQTVYQDIGYGSFLPAKKAHSAFLSASQSFGALTLELDGFYNRRTTRSQVPINGVTVSVPSTNPFYINPFGGTAPVRVEYDFTRELGAGTNDGRSESFAITGGPRLELGSGWQAALTGVYSQTRETWVRTNRVDSAKLAAVLADANRATALNVFGNGTANNPVTLASIRRVDDFDRATNRLASVEALMDGPLFALPGGDAKIALGGAWRRESIEAVSNFSLSGADSESRESYSLFGEIALPLIGPEQNITAIEALRLSIAGRWDRYSDFGDTFNPKVGATWTLVRGFDLRASWGTSFRVPPYYLASTVVSRPQVRTATITDPTAPNRTALVAALTGASTGLTEETAQTWSAGIDLTPTPGLTLSATYFLVDYKNRVDSPFVYTQALSLEAQFAGTGLIIREPTAAQVAAYCAGGYAGSCGTTTGIRALIDARRRNIALTHVRGMDFDLRYAFDTRVGKISASAAATLLFQYDKAISSNSPIVQVLDTLENPISFRARASLGWRKGGWSAALSGNYSTGYRNTVAVPAQDVNAWTTVDLSMGYSIGEGRGALSGTELRLAATNLFDARPPLVDAVLGTGFDAANADIIGRQVSVQLVKRW